MGCLLTSTGTVSSGMEAARKLPFTGRLSRFTKNKNKTDNEQHHMKNTKTLLAGAALAGIITGGFAAKANAATNTGGAFAKQADSQQAGVLADEKKGETHDCKGKNSCKGKGGCKTGDNGCAGKNSCKGKGGCAVKDGKPVAPKK